LLALNYPFKPDHPSKKYPPKIEKIKFKKDRLIPLPASVAVELENYLAARRGLERYPSFRRVSNYHG
jgi:hypothetical protein